MKWSRIAGRRALVESLEPRALLSVGGLPINIGGPTLDTGKRVAFTPDGGFIAAGLFSGTVDFDPGAGVTNLKSAGDTDIYVAKYSSIGALQWARQIGGNALGGGVLLQGILDFASSPLRTGSYYLNGVGADIRSAAENVNDMAVAPDGGVVLVGHFIGTVDFDPGKGKRTLSTPDTSYPDAFVVKLTVDGKLAWVQQFGGRFTDLASAIAFDTSGSIFVTGQFSRTVSFLPGNAAFTRESAGRSDAFAMKLSPTGKIRWVDTFGGVALDQAFRDAGNDVAIDARGNVFVAGTFAGLVDFNSSPSATAIVASRGGTDGFLLKLDNHGDFMKVATFGDLGFDGLSSVAIDATNSPAIAGYFQGTTFDADPGAGAHVLHATPINLLGIAYFTDAFIEKLNPNLEFGWVQQLAGTGYELVDQIKIDSAGSIVVGGSFYGSAVFGLSGPTLTSTVGVNPFYDANDGLRTNSYDPFIWKVSSGGATSWVSTWGSAGDDIGAGLDIASDNSIIFTGRYHGTVDFDPGAASRRLRSSGISDAFITGFDLNGVPLF